MESNAPTLGDLTPSPAVTAAGPPVRRRLPIPIVIALALVGGLAGVSGFFHGFYDFPDWGPMTLVLLVGALALVAGGRGLSRGAGLAMLTGLLGLWLWTLLSPAPESADQAALAANRWLLYAALLAVALLLLDDPRGRLVLLGAALLGLVALEVVLAARLAGSSGTGLFLLGRLDNPLGYSNGLASYLLLGVWGLIALAESSRHPVVAGPAAGLAALGACEIVLTQSRGAALAGTLSLILVLALVPGRVRRALVLLGVLAAVLAVLSPLLDVYRSYNHGALASTTVHHAVFAALLASGALAVVVAATVEFEGALQRRGPDAVKAWRQAGRVIVAFAGMCALVALLVLAGRLTHQVSAQYQAFISLREGTSSSRLFSGNGHRYDYWRIAWHEFRDHPVAGVGGGNYPREYFLMRQTSEDIRQPHSLELQTLSELGVLGGAALGIFLVGIGAAVTRRVRSLGREPADRGLVVGATGMVIVWLLQTSVDWLHLIPGLTGIALLAAATLAPPWRRARGRPTGLAIIPVAGAAALAAVGALTTARPLIADHYRAQARDELGSHPAAALHASDQALAYNPTSVPSYYTKAAALARLHDFEGARATMVLAVRREPHNFVSWVLLGDLVTRHGDIALAHAYYRRALELSPLDPSLPGLVRSSAGA